MGESSIPSTLQGPFPPYSRLVRLIMQHTSTCSCTLENLLYLVYVLYFVKIKNEFKADSIICTTLIFIANKAWFLPFILQIWHSEWLPRLPHPGFITAFVLLKTSFSHEPMFLETIILAKLFNLYYCIQIENEAFAHECVIQNIIVKTLEKEW